MNPENSAPLSLVLSAIATVDATASALAALVADETSSAEQIANATQSHRAARVAYTHAAVSAHTIAAAAARNDSERTAAQCREIATIARADAKKVIKNVDKFDALLCVSRLRGPRTVAQHANEARRANEARELLAKF